jgi:hypothetical protein
MGAGTPLYLSVHLNDGRWHPALSGEERMEQLLVVDRRRDGERMELRQDLLT